MTTPESFGPWSPADAQELRVVSSVLPTVGSVPSASVPTPGIGPAATRDPVSLPFSSALDPFELAQALAVHANRIFSSGGLPTPQLPAPQGPELAPSLSTTQPPLGSSAAVGPNAPVSTSAPASPTTPGGLPTSTTLPQAPGSSEPRGLAQQGSPQPGAVGQPGVSGPSSSPSALVLPSDKGAPAPRGISAASAPSGVQGLSAPGQHGVIAPSSATAPSNPGAANLGATPSSTLSLPSSQAAPPNPFTSPLVFDSLDAGGTPDAWFGVPLLDGFGSNGVPEGTLTGASPAGVSPDGLVANGASPATANQTTVYPWDISHGLSTEVPLKLASPGFFDPYSVRAQFPILKERVNGRELVWLDNAATTQKPMAVIDRLSTFYQRENSNIHRAAHTLAARATDAYETARETVRRVTGAPSTDTIVFVRGATEGINLIAKSYGRQVVKEGDEILISWLEHHANIVPWQQLCAETGARLRVAPVDDRGQVILSEYQRLLSHKTRIVSFTQVSNALGTVTPAADMIEIAHRYGAKVVLDGAQGISHMPVDVQALDCDFYVFSGHKVFGPTGIGAVYGKADLLESMPPWQGGGNMIQDVTHDHTTFHKAPARFEAGTGNIADAVGLGAALDWLSRLGIHNVQQWEHELLEYGTAQLLTVPGLRLIGTAADKAGVLSFVLKGQKTESVGGLLDKDGIAVRSGHHCAQPILRRFGLEATVRASLAPYNTKEDLDALTAALCKIQRDSGN